ncbi:hypothetical protein NN561_009624 [Cricetulus griseus]
MRRLLGARSPFQSRPSRCPSQRSRGRSYGATGSPASAVTSRDATRRHARQIGKRDELRRPASESEGSFSFGWWAMGVGRGGRR